MIEEINIPRRVNGILHTGQADADFMDLNIQELKMQKHMIKEMTE